MSSENNTRSERSSSGPTSYRKPVYDIAGLLLPWFITDVEYPWVGGNYYQLDRMIRSGLGVAEEPIRNLRDFIKDKDAGAMHADDLWDFAHKIDTVNYPTAIYIHFLEKVLNSDEGQSTDTVISDFSEAFLRHNMSDNIRISSRTVTQRFGMGELTGYFTLFQMAGAPGDYGNYFDIDWFKTDWFKAEVVIPLGKIGIHLFSMGVAKSRLDIRLPEFESMIRRIQYDPRIMKKVTS